ncbi:hypothetical protein ABFA07_013176 [Porites harrisoni]
MSHQATLWRATWLLFTMFAVFSRAVAFKNISVHHDETDESDKIGELLGTSFQAKWFTGLSNNMLSDISFAWRKQGTRFDPIAIIQSISDLLKKESR